MLLTQIADNNNNTRCNALAQKGVPAETFYKEHEQKIVQHKIKKKG